MARARLSLKDRLARYHASGMVRPALSAGPTPISSGPATGSGVQMDAAARTATSTSDAGNLPATPTPARIPDQKGTVRALEEWASQRPSPMPAARFVRSVFEEPYPPRLRRPQNERLLPLREGSLSFWTVLAHAMEWDGAGETTPAEFVRALSCEVTGHERGDAVSSVLNSIGDETLKNVSDDSDKADEYGAWRYGE